ncbi:hypothetical protein BC833DRAFT_450469 [Globomyces pollinis-pini]|nr:hypothetical protein BC833DRAFT_450469 [Globomyces pollinis-pini]
MILHEIIAPEQKDYSITFKASYSGYLADYLSMNEYNDIVADTNTRIRPFQKSPYFPLISASLLILNVILFGVLPFVFFSNITLLMIVSIPCVMATVWCLFYLSYCNNKIRYNGSLFAHELSKVYQTRNLTFRFEMISSSPSSQGDTEVIWSLRFIIPDDTVIVGTEELPVPADVESLPPYPQQDEISVSVEDTEIEMDELSEVVVPPPTYQPITLHNDISYTHHQ